MRVFCWCDCDDDDFIMEVYGRKPHCVGARGTQATFNSVSLYFNDVGGRKCL